MVPRPLIAAGVAVIAVFAVVMASAGAPDSRPACFDRSSEPLPRLIATARVPTTAQADHRVHLHTQITIRIRGRPKVVPAAIGLPANPRPERTSALHTHTSDGVLHNEGARGATLGQFFAVWGLALNERCIGDVGARDGERVRMWVDGRPDESLGAVRLKDGQEVVLTLGDDDAMPLLQGS